MTPNKPSYTIARRRLEAVWNAGNVGAVVGASSNKLQVVREIANLNSVHSRSASILARLGAGLRAGNWVRNWSLDHAIGDIVAEWIGFALVAGWAARVKRLPVAIPVAHLDGQQARRTPVCGRSTASALHVGGRRHDASSEGKEGDCGLHVSGS